MAYKFTVSNDGGETTTMYQLPDGILVDLYRPDGCIKVHPTAIVANRDSICLHGIGKPQLVIAGPEIVNM